MERKAAGTSLQRLYRCGANAAHTHHSAPPAYHARREHRSARSLYHTEQSFMSQMLRTKHRHRLQQKMNNHHQHHPPAQQQQAAVKMANGSAANKRPLHLQCVDKVHEFPVLEAAFGSFSSLYGRVKVRDQNIMPAF